MPFNINAFKFEIDSYGYMKTNTFEVFVFTPPVMQDFKTSPMSLFSVNRHLKMRIEQVSIPGISLQSVEANRYGIGMPQKMTVGALPYGLVTFSMLLDGYGEMYEFWEQWIRNIYEYNGISHQTLPGAPSNASPSFQVEYKEQYATDIQIVVYDQYGNTIQKINLKDAYPVIMRDIQLGWDSPNLMRLQVGIAYSEHNIEHASALQIIAQQGINFATTAINRAITS
jgi:hypothetical protein